MTTLQLREEQVLAVTEREREDVDTDNPIIYAETAPNRFASMTLFFEEEDGVRIVEDIDLKIIEVFYFDTEGNETALEETSTLYQWASEYFQDNWGN